MLDATIKTQLRPYLERLQRPHRTDRDARRQRQGGRKCARCSTTSPRCRQGQRRTTAATRVAFVRRRRQAKRRASVLRRHPDGPRIHSLVLALLQVGGHPPKVEPEAMIEQIKAIPASSISKPSFSLSCHNCPDVVQALNRCRC